MDEGKIEIVDDVSFSKSLLKEDGPLLLFWESAGD